MIESIFVTILPILFLITLFGGGAAFRRMNIDMDGKTPINKLFFYTSKYAIVLIWMAAIAQAWGVNISVISQPKLLISISLCLWTLGFLLLFTGRFGLGNSFRIGSPKESTTLKTEGLFSLSRNPMYLGVYSTLIGSTLYTLNPIALLISVFIIAIHHKIVLAEEEYLEQAFGGEYISYYNRVRRYL